MSAPVEIVAEIANAHQGDPDQAFRLAEAAAAAGADAVKFQIYFAHELLVRAHPRFEHFSKQSFAPEAWRSLLAKARGLGVKVYCDVFGPDALELAAACGVDGFKVHSSDLGNEMLLRRLSALPGRVFLSTGGSTAREIAAAVRLLASASRRPVLLHGYQSYPTPVEDSGLARLEWLRRHFGRWCDVGYQDHVAGDDSFAVTLPVLALGLGARVLEKHVTFNRAAKGVDYYSSIEPEDFARFVATVRMSETAIGATPERFTASEREYRRTVKKQWVAARALPAGHLLAPADLAMKRVADAPGEPVEIEKLLGRPLVRAVADEEILTRAHVKNIVWAIVVARMRSSRLPGKALADMAGMPAIQHLLERLKLPRSVDRVVLCTTTQAEDDPLARIARHAGFAVHRGPVEDVLGRMLGALAGHEVDLVLRVTGDDILVDPDYVDSGVQHHLATNSEYTDLKALPSGTEVEVFDAALLSTLHALAEDPQGTEYLTTYVTANADQIRITSAPVAEHHRHDWRLTLDTPEDYEVIGGLVRAMAAEGKALDYRLDDIVAYFKAHPDALVANAMVRQRSTPPQVNTRLNWSGAVEGDA